MDLTKFGHACVVLRKNGRTIVIDAGGLTPEDATAGAESLLITHEHFDHFAEQTVRSTIAQNPGLQVFTNAAVAAQLTGLGSNLHIVGHGDTFATGGFDIQVHGEWHAQIHPDIPRVTNVGFLVDEHLFHPGDALTVPDAPITTLLLPIHSPWSRTGELIDWVREVDPKEAIAIHDGALNEVGIGMLANFLGDTGPGTGAGYRRLTPGDTVQIS